MKTTDSEKHGVKNRWLGRLTSLLLVGYALGSTGAERQTASPLPFEKGTRWVYEADVQWTPVEGSGQSGVRSARLKWTTEILECVQGRSARAAVIHAFPTEVLGMDPETPRGYTILIACSNAVYRTSAPSARKAGRVARTLVSAPEKLADLEVLLELPLQVDKRWGCIGSPDREDGWYCWRVEAVKAQRLAVKGLSPDDYRQICTVAFRTAPDHTVMDICPGVGITRLEYEHHGTVGIEQVRLVEFKPATSNPPGNPRASAKKESPAISL